MKQSLAAVFLVAFTDLPIGETQTAPIWNEETVMDWPNATPGSSAPHGRLPSRARAGYRVGVYEYVYEIGAADAVGTLRVTSDRTPRATISLIFDPPSL